MEQINLPGYEIKQTLGEGGMGVVYVAIQKSLNRHVVIKSIKEEYAQDIEFIERFDREAKTMASLQHPNIVSIFEFINQKYIVMEYIKGEALSAIIEKSPLTELRAIRIFIKVAEGLECVHKNGILHRDIKPANIMIMEGDIPKIMDFGLARIPDSDKTKIGQTMGTPLFMSPEQAKGKLVDARSDIYSLGLTVFVSLKNEPPDSIENISNSLKGISEELIKVIQKCVNKNPEYRYQSMSELIDDLKKCEESILKRKNKKTIIATILDIENSPRKIKSRYFYSFILLFIIIISAIIFYFNFLRNTASDISKIENARINILANSEIEDNKKFELVSGLYNDEIKKYGENSKKSHVAILNEKYADFLFSQTFSQEFESEKSSLLKQALEKYKKAQSIYQLTNISEATRLDKKVEQCEKLINDK